jgi:hypothetical protein
MFRCILSKEYKAAVCVLTTATHLTPWLASKHHPLFSFSFPAAAAATAAAAVTHSHSANTSQLPAQSPHGSGNHSHAAHARPL